MFQMRQVEREVRLYEWWERQKDRKEWIGQIDKTIREEIEKIKNKLHYEGRFTHVSYQLLTASEHIRGQEIEIISVIAHFQLKVQNKETTGEWLIKMDRRGVISAMNTIRGELRYQYGDDFTMGVGVKREISTEVDTCNETTLE